MHCGFIESEYDWRPDRWCGRKMPRVNKGRMCMTRLLLAAAAVLAAGIVPAQAQQADGRMLAMSCLNCHGPGGRSPGDIPSIAGKSEDFLKNAMVDFRDGKRSGAAATVMGRLAKGYSDAEIAAVAKYIATLK
jgi:sulfide dehydrogenase cytochrome subunit